MSARVSRSLICSAYRVHSDPISTDGRPLSEDPPDEALSTFLSSQLDRQIARNSAARTNASLREMDTRVLVVSLGRVVADQVRVDATEAYAVLQQCGNASRPAATMALP